MVTDERAAARTRDGGTRAHADHHIASARGQGRPRTIAQQRVVRPGHGGVAGIGAPCLRGRGVGLVAGHPCTGRIPERAAAGNGLSAIPIDQLTGSSRSGDDTGWEISGHQSSEGGRCSGSGRRASPYVVGRLGRQGTSQGTGRSDGRPGDGEYGGEGKTNTGHPAPSRTKRPDRPAIHLGIHACAGDPDVTVVG